MFKKKTVFGTVTVVHLELLRLMAPLEKSECSSPPEDQAGVRRVRARYLMILSLSMCVMRLCAPVYCFCSHSSASLFVCIFSSPGSH